MKTGDIARFVGLVNNAAVNGEYVEILTELHETTVPEDPDGRRVTALRYGVQIIRTGATGYAKPQNLHPEPGMDRQSVFINLFGTERP